MTTFFNQTTLTPATSINPRRTPAIFATAPNTRVSSRYEFIPTSGVLAALGANGFQAVKAVQARSVKGNRDHAKHLVRLRHVDMKLEHVGQNIPEIVLTNSHNGSSAFCLMLGIYRVVCMNGLVVGSSFEDFRIRHTGNAATDVVEAAFKIIEVLPKLNESVAAMQAIRLGLEERQAFARAALELRYDTSEGNNSTPIQANQLLGVRRASDRVDDLYTTFNTVQENLLKGGLRRNDQPRRHTRRISSVNEDVKLNRALWTLAEEMGKLKG